MTFKERKEKLNYLLYLLEQNRLCALDCVADKFGCSRRTVERMLNDLKNEGHDIRFSKQKQKYFIEK